MLDKVGKWKTNHVGTKKNQMTAKYKMDESSQYFSLEEYHNKQKKYSYVMIK